MPNCLSAEKRVRQNLTRNLRNKARKTELKTLAKKFTRAIHDGEQESAAELYRTISKRLDQAACKNVIHKNTAARNKSRFANELCKAQAAK